MERSRSDRYGNVLTCRKADESNEPSIAVMRGGSVIYPFGSDGETDREPLSWSRYLARLSAFDRYAPDFSGVTKRVIEDRRAVGGLRRVVRCAMPGDLHRIAAIDGHFPYLHIAGASA